MKTTYIDSISSFETGGAVPVDFVHLKDGRVLGISDDCVVLYDSIEDFYECATNDRQCINLLKD